MEDHNIIQVSVICLMFICFLAFVSTFALLICYQIKLIQLLLTTFIVT